MSPRVDGAAAARDTTVAAARPAPGRGVLIYHHPECPRCTRIAGIHHAFDWRGLVEDTTEPPPGRPLRVGEVRVLDRATGEIHAGADAFDAICRAIPLYAPMRPFLQLRRVRALVDREMAGCDDGSCQV